MGSSLLDQAASLHLVDEAYQAARKHADPLAEGLLTQPIGLPDDAEDTDVNRFEPQGLESVGGASQAWSHLR